MNRALIGILAGFGALAALWLTVLGAIAAYDAMTDHSVMGDMGGMMGDMRGMMGDMRGMMDSMMGGGAEVTSGSASGQGEVTIAGFRFTPSRLTVTPGTVVRWANEDRAPHTATARDGSFDSGRLSQGQSFEATFDRQGSFAYFCAFHPWMEATVIVE